MMCFHMVALLLARDFERDLHSATRAGQRCPAPFLERRSSLGMGKNQNNRSESRDWMYNGSGPAWAKWKFARGLEARGAQVCGRCQANSEKVGCSHFLGSSAKAPAKGCWIEVQGHDSVRKSHRFGTQHVPGFIHRFRSLRLDGLPRKVARIDARFECRPERKRRHFDRACATRHPALALVEGFR